MVLQSGGLPTIRLIAENSDQTAHIKQRNHAVQSPADFRWLRVEEFIQARSFAPNTQKAYQRELKRFLTWINQAWADLTPRQIAQYKGYLQKQDLAASSINRSLTALMSFFEWLRSAYPEQIAYDPTGAVDLERVPLPPAQDLAEIEVLALYAALSERTATEVRDRAILAVLSHGLRSEEVVSLNIGDFDELRLTIREAKDDSTGTVPLRQQAREQLNAYLRQRRDVEGELLDECPLFISLGRSRRGKRLGYQGFYYVVKALGAIASRWATTLLDSNQSRDKVPEWFRHLSETDLKQIVGLVSVHPHQLRHTFATGLLLNGMESVHARTLTRHKSEVSFKRYAKRALASAAERAFYQAIGELSPV